jgi:type VI protein secretion system component VasK
MPRAAALALAVVVVVLIFGLALLAVQWFAGTVAFWQTVNAGWFPAAVIVFNGLIFSVGAGVAIIFQRRAQRKAEAEEKRLLPASVRFRRNVERDRASL